MKPHIIKSPGALALGVFFACVTGVTILKDVVMDGAEFNLVHLQALAAMVAAIAAGHYIIPTLKQKRILAPIGLALVFAAATGYVVVSAGARNAETAGMKSQAIEARNAERASARNVLAKAEADTIAAKAAAEAAIRAAAVECASGKGEKCRGKEATREAAKDDLAKAKDTESLKRGQMLLLGPDENPFEGYHHAGRTFESLGIGQTATTEAKLELLMPFALVLISEMATLIFIGIGLGHVQPPAVTSERPAQASDTSGQTDYPALSDADLSNVRMLFVANDDPSGPKGGTKVIRPERWTREEVRADLQARIDNGESFPSQRAMSQMYGVPTSTLSDWFRVWSEEGAEIERVKVGRRKVVGA